jgi:endonuclease G
MKLLFLIIMIITYSYSKESFELGCSQVIDNGYFKLCYSYKEKSTIKSLTTLYGDKVDTLNIKERYNFYSESSIPKEYRTYTENYINTGFDRGHINADANFDYSTESLKSTYSMSNITAQYPNTNRFSYLEVEKYIRDKAQEQKIITEYIEISYTDKTINNDIFIPSSFYIEIYNENTKFKECFKVPNDNIKYFLNEMRINCNYK